MQETDFWTQSAKAMELTIEGDRLIAREIADLARTLWARLIAKLDAMSNIDRPHLPPI